MLPMNPQEFASLLATVVYAVALSGGAIAPHWLEEYAKYHVFELLMPIFGLKTKIAPHWHWR